MRRQSLCQMKTPVLTSIAVIFVAVGCTSIVASTTRSSRDWQFVQSVGGIAVGTPTRDSRGHVLLPIRCDVSGVNSITTKPSTMNSALVCVAPSTRVRNSTVYLTIRTSLPAEAYDCRCPTADLGAIAPGEYSVIYRSPRGDEHSLDSIEVPRQ